MGNWGVDGDHWLDHGEHHYEGQVDEMGQDENHGEPDHDGSRLEHVDDDHANYLDGDLDENDGHCDPDGHVVEEIRGVDHHGEAHDELEWVCDEVHHEDHVEHSVEEHDVELHDEHFDQFLNKWVFLGAFSDI